MSDHFLYRRLSVRAIHFAPGTLVIIARCPKPPDWVKVEIERSPVLVFPPIYLLVGRAKGVGDPAGSDLAGGGGGEIPFPIGMGGSAGESLEGSITVVGPFQVLERPETVRVMHAEGEDVVPVEDVRVPAEHSAFDASASGKAKGGSGDNHATGYSDTSFEDAFQKAAEAALRELPRSHVADGLAIISVVGSGALYGGLIGYSGTRFVTVRATQDGTPGTAKMADFVAAPGHTAPSEKSPVSQLTLKLEVNPSTIYVNKQPGTPDRPQPKDVNIKLMVTNWTRTDYHHLHPNSRVFRMWALNGRTTLWSFPELILDVLTDASIAAGRSRTYSAVWRIADARTLLENQGISVGARFEPTGQAASAEVPVKIAV